ncbi:hypothetical protein CEXT_248591 [Caerostris extrusa]|uniref:Uncharacterized protein n=1 Tax=Caerostris extrusa TaxID=172846 RepID=A0AAV4SFR5_CAEEX|nr:hypothetical protein CEXT_248591 [Caerostris extrusa]
MSSPWLTIGFIIIPHTQYVIMEPYCWKCLLYGVPLDSSSYHILHYVEPHCWKCLLRDVSFDLSSSHIFQHYVFLERSSPWLTIGFIIIPHTQLCYYGTILLEISPLWGTIGFILIPHTPLC